MTVLALRDGRTISALDIQRQYVEAAHRFVAERGADVMTLDVLSHWTRQIEALATNPLLLVGEVDWIAKRAILEGYRNRDHAQWDDPRRAAVDIQYGDLRGDKGLARVMQAKGRQHTMFSEQEIAGAIENPPHDTRAYFRGMCMRTYTDSVAAASWDSVIMDLGPERPLHRITTGDARKGTRDLTESLFTMPVEQFVATVGA
jgi:proteasome accessory factor A